MIDPAPQRGPTTPQEKWAAALFLLVIVGLFAAEVWHNYQPLKLAALLVVLFWIPLLALHEAGHAVAAWWCGWHVHQVVIGMGKLLHQFHVGTIPVEIRLAPIEGFVLCRPTNLHWPRFKSAAIYFAGPGVELLLAAAVLALVGPEQLLRRTNEYWLIAAQSLALAATAHGVLNLIPHAAFGAEGELVSDGLGILRSLLRPPTAYAALIEPTTTVPNRPWTVSVSDDWAEPPRQ